MYSQYQLRRRLLMTGWAGIASFLLHPKVTASRDWSTLQVPVIPPPRPRREDGSEDPSQPSIPPGATRKAVLEEHQKDIKKEIEKLYDLATQLKTEVEKTDATTVLSVSMIKKAEEIEKLAKQIKDHAKGG
jgi:hypothetical protein